ncbi:hypothetical protein C9446_05560 [Providencia heimbachae]|uniref:hypothetical protein n=1 Tax=Providencia heimbachae TaxID=333962 RepID=UPI0010BECDFC|nr:hypothetical protein [Providencia heimbachae]QCJ69376.1 hypothetical protein C9446_05560 [Providencia heimbachae]
MKKTGFVLITTLLLSGCHIVHPELNAFDCNIDKSFNDITRERGGLFAFPLSSTQARVYVIDKTIHIMKFERGDYTGYQMTRNERNRQIESIKDFKVTLNEGDFYYDDGRAIEVLSSDKKTIGFYYVEPSTGKVNSIQFLTECARSEAGLKELSHADHNH